MTLPAEVVEQLNAPLDPKRVQKREGSGGRQLSYLEGHDVIRTANTIFGVGEWSYEVQELTHLGTELLERGDRKGNRVAYRAIVRATYNGHPFSDVGYGDATEYTGSALTPHELASKEAVTDALKRSLKNYGDQFGLCLYSKDAPEHRGGSAARVSANAGATAAAPATPPAVSTVTAPAGQQLAGDVKVHFGKNKDVALRSLPRQSAKWYAEKWEPDADRASEQDLLLKAAAVAFATDNNAVVGAPVAAGGSDPWIEDPTIPFMPTGGEGF